MDVGQCVWGCAGFVRHDESAEEKYGFPPDGDIKIWSMACRQNGIGAMDWQPHLVEHPGEWSTLGSRERRRLVHCVLKGQIERTSLWNEI